MGKSVNIGRTIARERRRAGSEKNDRAGRAVFLVTLGWPPMPPSAS
ncbi:MAG: hypothetical protein Q4B91_05930 [Atopobiaceae bacterium]|nr:hypothetical protein [Atopobiaceae bacterium]